MGLIMPQLLGHKLLTKSYRDITVSATVLMFKDWATMINSMAELEQSITDHLTETSH
jgi:hypothetical protein